MKSPHRVTLKDIANATGVSINTVSAVLNSRSTQTRVGEKTRREIQKVASRLGYIRNSAASLLAGGRTRTLGILTEDLFNTYGAPLTEAFEQEAAKRGYQCFLGCTQYDETRKAEYVQRFLEHHVEGMLLMGAWNDPEIDAALERALNSGTRIVIVDIPWRGHKVPAVCGNHFQGGLLLANHLIDLGHRHILYLTTEGIFKVFSVQERIRGMRTAIESHRNSGCTFEINNFEGITPEKLGEVALEALQSRNPPSAIAVVHDTYAFRIIHTLRKHGIRVPQDVALTGYDDSQYEMFRPLGFNGLDQHVVPLTTVRQPVREIGIQAARVLIDSIEDPRDPVSSERYLDVQLIVRDSSSLPDRLARKGKKNRLSPIPLSV